MFEIDAIPIATLHLRRWKPSLWSRDADGFVVAEWMKGGGTYATKSAAMLEALRFVQAIRASHSVKPDDEPIGSLSATEIGDLDEPVGREVESIDVNYDVADNAVGVVFRLFSDDGKWLSVRAAEVVKGIRR